MASFPGITSALSQNPIDRLAGIALVTVLMMGCFAILRPFLSAILWAVILSFSTWPVYHRIERAVRGRQGLAAGLMVVLVAAVLIGPLVFLGTSLVEDVTALIEMVRQLLSQGPPNPPAWVAQLPVVGSPLHDRWQAMAGSGAKLTAELTQYLIPLRDWVLRRAADLGGGILYLSLSVFIAFFSTGTIQRYPRGWQFYLIESVESRRQSCSVSQEIPSRAWSTALLAPRWHRDS